MDAKAKDRAVGALLGLAVGDALGTTLEFAARDTYPTLKNMVGGGPFNLEAGQWTDDTAMALALADSLIARGELDAADLAKRFVSWWHLGIYSCTGDCFDIGITTRIALGRAEATGDPFAGSTSEDSAGNGSIMRLAPAALFGWNDREQAIDVARQQSRVTHGAPQAVDACGLMAAALVDAIGTGELRLSSDTILHPALAPLVQREFDEKPRSAITSSGYVVDTLEAALWAVTQSQTFEDALVLAVNLGGDADTVGAVTGQIAGALYGASAIPERWLEPLAWRERLGETAEALLTARKA